MIDAIHLYEYEVATKYRPPVWKFWMRPDTVYGTIAAASEQSALNVLSAWPNLEITDIKPLSPMMAFYRRLLFHSRVPQDVVTYFIDNYSTMTADGNVGPQDACETLASMEQNAYMRLVISAIGALVAKSTKLWEACSLFPDVFSSYIVAVIRSGENKGESVLHNVLEDLNLELRLKAETEGIRKRLLRDALGTGGTVFVMLAVFFIYLIPVLGASASKTPEFPLLAGLIAPFIWLSGVLQNWAADLLLALFGALVAAAYRVAVAYPRGRYLRDLFVLRYGREYGRVVALQSQADVFRSYARLHDLGAIPFDAWTDASATADNLVFEEAFLEVRDRIEKGIPLFVALRDTELIDPRAIALIRASEPVGPDVLCTRLLQISKTFRRETKERFERMLETRQTRSNWFYTTAIIVVTIVTFALFGNSLITAGDAPAQPTVTKGIGQP